MSQLKVETVVKCVSAKQRDNERGKQMKKTKKSETQKKPEIRDIEPKKDAKGGMFVNGRQVGAPTATVAPMANPSSTKSGGN